MALNKIEQRIRSEGKAKDAGRGPIARKKKMERADINVQKENRIERRKQAFTKC
jgi:hypothetical protein